MKRVENETENWKTSEDKLMMMTKVLKMDEIYQLTQKSILFFSVTYFLSFKTRTIT